MVSILAGWHSLTLLHENNNFGWLAFWLVGSLAGWHSLTLLHENNNIFARSVDSNPVKMGIRHTMTLPPFDECSMGHYNGRIISVSGQWRSRGSSHSSTLPTRKTRNRRRHPKIRQSWWRHQKNRRVSSQTMELFSSRRRIGPIKKLLYLC